MGGRMQPTTEDVAHFFGALWPGYCQEDVDIELMPGVRLRVFEAVTCWDRDNDCFYVLADVTNEPKSLLYKLFHELRHVVAGDVKKNGGGVSPRGMVRRLMMGHGQTDDHKTMGRVMDRSKSVEGASKEDGADNWSWGRVQSWWPVLEGAGTLAEAIGIARWTIAQNGGKLPT